MSANNDMLRGRWFELKGQLKQHWGKLTEDDIANLSGKQEELVYVIRRRYGYAHGQTVMEIQRWISNCDRDSGRTSRDSRVS